MNLCKLFLLSYGCLLFASKSLAQTFYVNCADDRAYSIVCLVLQKMEFEITTRTVGFDFAVDCIISENKSDNYNKPFSGYMVLYNSEGKEIARTKTIKRKACAANGFNAAADIFQVLAESYLSEVLRKIFPTKEIQ
jgi:hypothetical protein